MKLDCQSYRRYFLANPGFNDAADFGVSIEHVAGAEWICLGVHKLMPAENEGSRNVYAECVGADGLRIDGQWLQYTWDGRRPDEPAPDTPLDKPANEPAGNIPLGQNQAVTLWVRGSGGSDRVHGLSTMHGGEGGGNEWGHYSYFVVFQRGAALPVTPPVEPVVPVPVPPGIDVTWLRGQLVGACQELQDLQNRLCGLIEALPEG
jgi:hypothetical protein